MCTVRHRSLISFIWEYLTMSKRFPVTFLGLTCAPLTCAAGGNCSKWDCFASTRGTDKVPPIVFLWLFHGVCSIPRYFVQLYFRLHYFALLHSCGYRKYSKVIITYRKGWDEFNCVSTFEKRKARAFWNFST